MILKDLCPLLRKKNITLTLIQNILQIFKQILMLVFLINQSTLIARYITPIRIFKKNDECNKKITIRYHIRTSK